MIALEPSGAVERNPITFMDNADLTRFAAENILDTAETAEILKCSRQYVDQLVKQGKLVPIKHLS